MDWLQFGVQWLHVLLGIFWFGNAIAAAAILIPAIPTLPIPTPNARSAAATPASPGERSSGRRPRPSW